MKSWKYSDLVDEPREKRLASVESYYDIINQIEREMSILCYHVQTCDDDSHFARPIFCIKIPEELFDTFFNSPVGYRGSYFLSVFHGMDCNHQLMKTLLPKLSSWAIGNLPSFDIEFTQEAMLALSAKAWLAEKTLHLCSACSGEWSDPKNDQIEVINGRWDISESPKARYGRRAPQGTKIRIFGAFLNSNGDEFIPKKKRHRNQEIFDYGWS